MKYALIITAFSLAYSVASAESSDRPLARSGTAESVIMLAADAAAVERNAAQELAVYLQKVTGAKFDIVGIEEAGDCRVIAVGPGAARAVDPDLDLTKEDDTGLGDDGIVLQPVGEHIVLSGAEGAKRGTLYAVYEFLERVAGVRWWTPGEETVPANPNLSVPPLEIRYVPPFIYRETLCHATGPHYYSRTKEVPMFAVRMRQNGHFPKIPSQWGSHYTLIGWCHTFYGGGMSLMPPEKHFEQRPEWYSEINGKRTFDRAQLCMTNDGMLEELASSVLAEIRKRPEAGMISVAQNDHRGNCQCTNCRALDEAEGSPAGSLIYGINRVAEIVEKEFPDFLIVTLAYQYTRKPPKTIRPRNNVVIRYCVIERSAVQPIAHLTNRDLLEDLEGWAKIAPKLAIWDYTANLKSPFTPEPRALVYGPDMRLYQRCHVNSVFCEHSHGTSPLSDFEPLHTWLLSKLMWNPDQDEHALIREFLDGYFGPAGRTIGEYLQLLSGAAANARVRSWAHGHDAEWLDLETMNRATALFAQAEAAVAGDEALLGRVRRARLSLDHQWLVGYLRYRVAAIGGARFSGPAGVNAAIDDFVARAKAAGVDRFGYGRNPARTSIEEHGAFLRERNVLADEERYLASLAGKPVPLPETLANIPPHQVIDLQEHALTLFPGSQLAPDESASNGAAAKMDPSARNWSVQARRLPDKGVSGRFHAYAVIRCEAIGKSGVAFDGGVYDTVAKKGVKHFRGRLQPGSASSDNMRDNRYHVVDLGIHEFRDGLQIWFGTTGGVSKENVKAIYVDRVILVKENPDS